ncbi:hypothetical protein DLAC_00201 [Tieghemostelium lacteum]|uniref:F-box domain-containing protein n=1 Tax=Tieghemostelium lacteum TaxID=361077 RepID=A0A152A9J9_TIELA|nr:hypothetical protein DLAC_00201 [Tieghemostelium lacteum]|eukprot:KYR02737.1 hypothetical protein DLAC_00201 [Tieghemostelium lacteum]
MAIPNYLIINILDPILNHSKDIEYVYMFLRKYTLISKEWNQSIIVKLQYRHVNNLKRPRTVELSKTVKLLPDFISLANKYKWYNYRFISPRHSTEHYKHLYEIIRDQFSQIEINNEQSKTLDQSISHFKNLESIVVETSFSDSEEILINQLKSLSNIDIHIESLNSDFAKSIIEFNRIGELIQNRRVISLHFRDFAFIGENDNPFQPNSLTKISLDKITMSQWMLKSLLDNSLNCQNLEIEDIVLNEDKNHYDKFFEILKHASQSMNLKRLRVVSTNITTSHQAAVDFLSNIKTGTLILVYMEWNNEAFSDNITNQWIHSLELFTKMDDRILELWKHKDNIKSIFAPIGASKNTVKEFKNLRYLRLPDLTSSMGIYDLSVHKNLHTIDYSELDIDVLNQLLSIPHTNIRRCIIHHLHHNENSIENDLSLFITSLSHNTTLTRLFIKDFLYSRNINYNHCELYIKILTINKTLHTFILPPSRSDTFKFTTDMVKEFNELFKINSTIQQMNCFNLSSESSLIQIKLDLLDVFTKYNVTINSSIYDM